ncbi:ATP phosphoribosyltransferase regulatory subunit, partial [Frankia sp. Cpl3]|nr:ATP phosphoribosyltransferase regulatory subunit [Frankia sp. Cpl3]
LISNLDYYTGIVFEGYAADLGSPLVGGGRYDHLLGQFGRPASATGFAIKMDRLLQVTANGSVTRAARTMLIYVPSKRLHALLEAQRLREKGQVVVTRLINSREELEKYRNSSDGSIICLTEG